MVSLLFTVMSIGNPYQVAEPNPFSVAGSPKSVPVPTLDQGYAESIRTGKPLVTFVGMKSFVGGTSLAKDAVVCEADSLGSEYPAKCVTIGVPSGRRVYWFRTLENPTTNLIWVAISQSNGPGPGRESLKARPFAWPLPSARHDDDLMAAGPWPYDLEFPSEMKRYKRAEMTQRIAVTNDRDTIEPVSRLQLDAKWHQSGGMLGIDDFRSDLYRYLPEPPKVWVGDIAVLNSFGHYQNNRGWKAQFPDGSKFLDVLSKDGDVFEIRERKKEEGRWQSAIVYENEKARPIGYTGLNVSCNSCHKEAGQGGYAVGLAPGGDGVLSVGFKSLER